MKNETMIRKFKSNGGILKTSQLNELGYSSRQIKRMLNIGIINRIKYGFYELSDYISREEVILTKLFPESVIFLESALVYYEYTDRIPSAWQIAVNRSSKTTQYDIYYPLVTPFYLEAKFLDVGVTTILIDKVKIKIYDRDRTICDVLRYENKLGAEVFSEAIQRYIKDPKKNVRKLFEYADIFNINNKVQMYIGMRL